jgi:triosephosphate isomerase
MRRLIAGNWKMNGLQAARAEARALVQALAGQGASQGRELPQVALCPPATLVADLARDLAGSGVMVGGQDCHTGVSGAHTGDVSAAMLADAGASFVILGHSERRADHGETDALVAAKAAAALAAGLEPIICVGETEAQRDDGQAESVVLAQLAGSVPPGADPARLVIAYEPVWAIGTGRTPTTGDVAAMHGAIRAALEDRYGAGGARVPILYGGSVKPSNAAELMAVANVNGALVGGASLKASDFSAIVLA